MNKQIGNVRLMQQMNRLKVLNFIRSNPDVVRPVIAEETGLSLASITNTTSYLLDINLITECGTEQVGRVGRKSTLLKFNSDAYGLICVILGKENIDIVHTNLEGRIISRMHNTMGDSPEKVIKLVQKSVNKIITEVGKENILGISVGISGLILDGSRLILSSSLKWKGFDIRKTLMADTGLPVFAENLSHLKAVWYFGCKKKADRRNMIFIDLENGIGATQFYNGSINRSVLGEIGHTTVEKDGEQCFCGNAGCLEAMCSVERTLRLYREHSGSTNADIAELCAKYDEGNDSAKKAIGECARYLGIGLANIINLLNPSVMVINSGDMAECKPILDEAEKEMLSRAYPALTKELAIYEINVTEEDAVKGAAFNLCDRLFDISFDGNIVE